MNKGRNIAVLLLCLVSISLLTFLTTLNRSNNSGVVDDVRYYLASTMEETKEYEFYFIEDDMMKGKLVTYSKEDSAGNLVPYEYSLSIEEHPYTYKITGEDKKSAEIEYYVIDEEKAEKEKAYDLFTEDFIMSMIYGAKPVLSVTQAIIVAFIAIVGGLILGKNEDLWLYFNKDSGREYPEWEELTKYKTTGCIILGIAIVLLLVFVIF